MVGAGPGSNLEVGTPSRSLAWVARVQALGSSSVAFSGALAGTWISDRATGTSTGPLT